MAETTETTARQEWMGLLARAPLDELAKLWRQVGDRPVYRLLRRPESGLVMVRGRTGGTGPAFNMGEIVVTRCSVSLTDGTLGHAYVAGRHHDKAEIAALIDAMLQDPNQRTELTELIIAPLREAEQQRRRETRARSAATKVDFFTMVRGEDA